MVNEIKMILSEVLKISNDELDIATNLRDKGLNSLKAVLLIVMIEEKFNFEVNNDDLVFKNLETVEDIVLLVKKYKGDIFDK